MPLYEYLCKKCGHRFETLVFGKQPPVCPSCQSADLDQEISTFAMGRDTRQGGSARTSSGAGCDVGGGGG
jgi:putative FmdB family regulatory protein